MISHFADVGGNRDPGEVFEMIVQSASAANLSQRYTRPLLEQMHNVATGRALQLALQHARRFEKWGEITRLANGYVRSSQALGVPLDARVLDGFERAARLSGNGWDRRMAQSWERDVGVQSGYQGADDGVLGHLARQILRGLNIRV
jgi:hypothetical protein